VHPLAFAPGTDDTGFSQIGKVPGNLGLGRVQYFDKVANTNLLLRYEV
jgi:hypothetical protein